MSGSLAAVTVRLLLSLGVVLAVMVVAARALRRRQGGGPVRRSSAAVVDVLARQALGRTASVNLLRVADRVLLVGVSEHGVQLLAELEPDSVPAEEAPRRRMFGARPLPAGTALPLAGPHPDPAALAATAPALAPGTTAVDIDLAGALAVAERPRPLHTVRDWQGLLDVVRDRTARR